MPKTKEEETKEDIIRILTQYYEEENLNKFIEKLISKETKKKGINTKDLKIGKNKFILKILEKLIEKNEMFLYDDFRSIYQSEKEEEIVNFLTKNHALKNYFKNLEKYLLGYYNLTTFLHKGLNGELREIVVQQFLKNILSSDIEISKGEIISPEGWRSPQIDIILKKQNSEKIELSQGIKTIFFKDVLMTIEVKSDLNEKAINQTIYQSKFLNRMRLREFGNLKSTFYLSVGKGKEIDYVPNILFAYKGYEEKAVLKKLDNFDDNEIPIVILNLEKNYLLVKRKEFPIRVLKEISEETLGGKSKKIPEDKRYISIKTGILEHLFIIITELCTLKAPYLNDLRNYFNIKYDQKALY